MKTRYFVVFGKQDHGLECDSWEEAREYLNEMQPHNEEQGIIIPYDGLYQPDDEFEGYKYDYPGL
jgi:hypothetical protein